MRGRLSRRSTSTSISALAIALARRLLQVLYRVRLGYADDEALARIEPNASVVFVMNHRSNADYISVAYMAANRAALSYAVGEWARTWPLQSLIKALGGFFVRRESDNPLYRRVLARYVQMATAGGVVQAFYPEGRFTRDGHLRTPRLGLLSYMVSAFDPTGERDLVFIPVGINYDRVLEDRTLVRDLDPQAMPRSRTSTVVTFLRFLGHNVKLLLEWRWYRFGYACVNFGTPLSMRSYTARTQTDFRLLDSATRFAAIERLGSELFAAIAAAIPALPVPLIATVFLHHPHTALSALEIKAHAQALITALEQHGAYVHIPRSDHDYATTVGLRMLVLRHLVQESDGLYRASRCRARPAALLRQLDRALPARTVMAPCAARLRRVRPLPRMSPKTRPWAHWRIRGWRPSKVASTCCRAGCARRT